MKYETWATCEDCDKGEAVFVAIEGSLFGYTFGVDRKAINQENLPTVSCTEPVQAYLDIYDLSRRKGSPVTLIAFSLLRRRLREKYAEANA